MDGSSGHTRWSTRAIHLLGRPLPAQHGRRGAPLTGLEADTPQHETGLSAPACLNWMSAHDARCTRHEHRSRSLMNSSGEAFLPRGSGRPRVNFAPSGTPSAIASAEHTVEHATCGSGCAGPGAGARRATTNLQINPGCGRSLPGWRGVTTAPSGQAHNDTRVRCDCIFGAGGLCRH